jgi:hypothetical protein
MSILNLPACPICGARDNLVRQAPDGASYVRPSYSCLSCGSVLAWLGDDLWLRGDCWAYQHVGREEMAHLLHKPLSAAELRQLASQASEGPSRPQAPVIDAVIEEAPAELIPPDRLAGARWRVEGTEADGRSGGVSGWSAPSHAPVIDATFEEAPVAPATPASAAGSRWEGEAGEAGALVPLARVLPEGTTLALVRYDGSRVVPVAVLDRGQLRALPTERRRSRGSPLLIVATGLTLLCLVCTALGIIASSFVDRGVSLPAVVPVALGTPLPSPTLAPSPTPPDTPTPEPTPTLVPTELPSPTPGEEPAAVLQGVSDYAAADGSRTIVGEVLNNSARNLHFVEVVASFYDAQGQLLAIDSSPVELDTVQAGSRVPFRLAVQDLPSSFATYQLRANYVATDEAPLRLDVVDQRSWRDDAGAYHVAGTVRNPNDFALTSAALVVTYFDAANQVLRVERAAYAGEPLQPGETWPFDLVLADPLPELSHYRLQTEAFGP